MLILFHVLVALGSIVSSGLTLMAPSKRRLHISGSLVVLTVASGTYIILSTHAKILQTCITGLIYLGFTFSCMILANRRLTKKIDV